MITTYVQIDGNLVTGALQTSGVLDPATFPKNRRFVQFAEQDIVPEMLSTVTIKGDDPITVYDPATVEFKDPVPPQPVPTPVDTKLEEILTEVKKLQKP